MSLKSRLSHPVIKLVVAAILLVNVAHADTNSVTIVRPTVFLGTTYPGVLILISPTYPGLDGCSNSSGQYVFIDYSTQTAPGGRDLYAQVLSAFLTGHTVAFGTQGCSSDGSYPRVVSVSIDP
jgi:hypothetical protein